MTPCNVSHLHTEHNYYIKLLLTNDLNEVLACQLYPQHNTSNNFRQEKVKPLQCPPAPMHHSLPQDITRSLNVALLSPLWKQMNTRYCHTCKAANECRAGSHHTLAGVKAENNPKLVWTTIWTCTGPTQDCRIYSFTAHGKTVQRIPQTRTIHNCTLQRHTPLYLFFPQTVNRKEFKLIATNVTNKHLQNLHQKCPVNNMSSIKQVSSSCV